MNQTSANPFPGLRPFEIDEREVFFGRTERIDELLSRLHRSRFIAVVGTSGSGKSSLVRAGLLAALKRGFMADAGSSWRVAVFRPINDPIGELAKALKEEGIVSATDEPDLIETTLRKTSMGLIEVVRQANLRADENLLVVVDQFEELFRFKDNFNCENPADEASAFVKLLLEATGQSALPIYLVLTMRSDYLGESARFSGLPEAINAGQYLVPRMNDEERREAITCPVAIRDARMTVPLVNRLLNDVGDDPDKLPLLQHALMRTWNAWKASENGSGNPLDVSHYESIGGIQRTLSNHANEVFDDLETWQQALVERIFKALTAKGPDGRGVRSPRNLFELCAIVDTEGAGPEKTESYVRDLVELFRDEACSFLMPPKKIALEQDTLIDISHETLIQGWDKLRRWVEEEATSASAYQHLAYDAVQFDQGKGNLLQSPELPVLLNWFEHEQKPNPAWAARYFNPDWKNWKEVFPKSQYDGEFDRAIAFLKESDQAEQDAAAARASEARAKKDLEERLAAYKHQAELTAEKQRRLRLLQWGMASLGLLLLFSLGAAAFAATQYSRAKVALAAAESAKEEAVTAAKEANKQMLMAKAAEERATTEKQKALVAQKASEEAKAEADVQRVAAQKSEEEAIKSREEAVISKNRAEQQRQRAESAEFLARNSLTQVTEALEEAKTQRNRATAAAEQAKQRGIQLKSALDELAELRLREGELAKAEIRSVQTSLRSVDSKIPHFADIIRHDSSVNVATFNEGPEKTNKRVVTASDDGQGYLVDVSKEEFGTPVKILSPKPFVPGDVAKLADLITKLKNEKNPLSNFLMQSKFSPTTQELLNGSDQPDPKTTQAIVNELNSLLRDPLFYKPERFEGVTLRDETKKLMATKPQGDDLVRLNRMLLEDAFGESIKADPLLPVLNSKSTRVSAFSPDSTKTAISSDNSISVFPLDPNSQSPPIALKGDTGNARTIKFSSRGKYILSTASDDHRVRVWTASTGERKKFPAVEKAGALAIFSPNEKYLATTSLDSQQVNIWSLEADGDPKALKLTSDSGKPLVISSLAFNQDATRLVTTAIGDKTVRVWDVNSGQLLRRLIQHECQVNSAEFDATGKRLVTAGDDGSAFIWDVETGKVKYELRGHREVVIAHTRKGIRPWLWPFPPPIDLDLRHREGQYFPLNSAKFDSSGNRVVTAGADGIVRIWTWTDNETFAQQLLELKGYTGPVLGAQFSPDDRFVIAMGKDGAARIWNAQKTPEDRPTSPKSCDDAEDIKTEKRKRP